MLFTKTYVSISQSLKLLIWAVHHTKREMDRGRERKGEKIGGGIHKQLSEEFYILWRREIF